MIEGPSQEMMLLARLTTDIYGRDAAEEALRAEFNLTDAALRCVMQQLAASTN